jgi:hypothetical protein
MITLTNRRFYVYGLYAMGRDHPLFYVGKGCGRRMFRHAAEEPTGTYKHRILNKYRCYPMIISGGLTESFAYALEHLLVKLYRKKLCNARDGGLGNMAGAKHSETTKARLRQVNLGKQCPQKTKAKISLALKRHFTRCPQLKGSKHFNYGRKHTVPVGSPRRQTKVDLDFVAYHIWAYEISGLSAADYAVGKPFTKATLVEWRGRRFKQFATKKPKPTRKHKANPKYCSEFTQTAVRMFGKSDMTQAVFANYLGIPRSTLNQFIQNARRN